MTIAQEEIFGPVLSIQPYDDEDDAIRIANDSDYGLAGGVWSADQDRAIDVARRIRTGQIEINGGAFNPLAPFGGYKQSGHGRENGRYAIEELLQVKSCSCRAAGARRTLRSRCPHGAYGCELPHRTRADRQLALADRPHRLPP